MENHIREVHKGHPVIVTELALDHDIDAPIGKCENNISIFKK